jgi:hypothetical protein
MQKQSAGIVPVLSGGDALSGEIVNEVRGSSGIAQNGVNPRQLL